MQEACKVLVGRHDFSSFRAAGCQVISCLLIHMYAYGISFMLVIKPIIVDGRDYFTLVFWFDLLIKIFVDLHFCVAGKITS